MIDKIRFKFLKDNSASCLSWAITIAWLIFIFLKIRNGQLPSDLNEFGDFLAGAFAPLAFFWLVRGYYQQGKGLEQNSAALKLQALELKASTDALNLQVKELKSSVEGQREIIDLTLQDVEQKHFQNEPHIDISLSVFCIDEQDLPEYDDGNNFVDLHRVKVGKFAIEVTSKCNVARSVKIYAINEDFQKASVFRLNEGEKLILEFKYYSDQLDKIEQMKRIIEKVRVEYADIFGKKYSKEFEVIISKGVEGYIEVYRQSI